jgi:hypothetical protein
MMMWERKNLIKRDKNQKNCKFKEGCVQKLIKIRLKLKFGRFSTEKVLNFQFSSYFNELLDTAYFKFAFF